MDDLRAARIDAMRESGDFVPKPGPLRKALDAVRRGRVPAITATAPGTADAAVMVEFQRRLAALPRNAGLVVLADALAERQRVSAALAADLEALASAQGGQR